MDFKDELKTINFNNIYDCYNSLKEDEKTVVIAGATIGIGIALGYILCKRKIEKDREENMKTIDNEEY